jgi:hypothetical protein
MMGPGAGMCSNRGPYARVHNTGFRWREGAHRDRVLLSLALGLRGLDLPPFAREVSRYMTEGSREPSFGWTAPSRENGLLGGPVWTGHYPVFSGSRGARATLAGAKAEPDRVARAVSSDHGSTGHGPPGDASWAAVRAPPRSGTNLSRGDRKHNTVPGTGRR